MQQPYVTYEQYRKNLKTWQKGYIDAYKNQTPYFKTQDLVQPDFNETIDPVDLNNVNRELLARLQHLGEDIGLDSITINDGFRTPARQQFMYDHQGQGHIGAANKVGKSYHEYGGAVDVDNIEIQNLSNEIFLEYGLIRTVSTEPWHIQLAKDGENFATNETEGKKYFDNILKWDSNETWASIKAGGSIK